MGILKIVYLERETEDCIPVTGKLKIVYLEGVN